MSRTVVRDSASETEVPAASSKSAIVCLYYSAGSMSIYTRRYLVGVVRLCHQSSRLIWPLHGFLSGLGSTPEAPVDCSSLATLTMMVISTTSTLRGVLYLSGLDRNGYDSRAALGFHSVPLGRRSSRFPAHVHVSRCGNARGTAFSAVFGSAVQGELSHFVNIV